MEKKKNKGLICLVVILIVLVLGLSGYIVFDKVFSSEKQDKDTTNKKTESAINKEAEPETLSIEDEIVEKLMEAPHYFIGDDYLDTYYDGVLYDQDYNVENIPDKIKILMGITASGIKIVDNKDIQANQKIVLKASKVREQVESIFGKNVKYTDQDVDNYGINKGIFKYDQKNDEYYYIVTTGSIFFTPKYKTLIVDAKKYDDRIEITEKVARLEYDVQPSGDYKINILKKKNDTDLIDTIKEEDNFSFDNYKNKLNSYKYTFNKDGNNYYFYSVELEK